VEFDLGHTVTLDPSWDGAMSDVSLKVTGITTDLATATLFASCGNATGDYICNGTGSNSGSTQDNQLKLKWRWGAFDQGLYTLKVTPHITIEGSDTSLPQIQTTFQIPIQSSGNILLTDQDDVNQGLSDYKYKFGLAMSELSTPTKPVLGLVYPSSGQSTYAYFTRFGIDRTAPPASSAASLSQAASQIDLTSGAIAASFGVKALPQGDWIAVGLKATSGTDDVVFNRLADSNGNPTNSASIELTQYSSTGNFAVDADLTDPFVEGATTKIMVPFVRNLGGQIRLSVAKVNVAGTSRASLLDDTRYGVEASGGYSVCDLDSGATSLGRLKASQSLEGNARYVYVSYKAGSDIKLTKALTQYDNGYGLIGPVVVGSGVFGGGSRETLDLKLGTYGGEATAAIVYATNKSGSYRCFVRRLNAGLNVMSSTLQIGTGTTECSGPQIHYVPQTSRFVVIYAERNSNNKYDLKYVELTPGFTDSLSVPTIVVQDLASLPIKIASAYYENGQWVGLVYRLSGVDQLRFHGFHVSGF
jgi:hypothetical protein